MFFVSHVIFFLALLCPFFVHAPLMLKADGVAGTSTFSFHVNAHVVDEDSFKAFLYMGRQDPTNTTNASTASYAISFATEGYDTIYPFSPQKVRLNGVPDQTNPLFGQQIALMGMFQRTPFAVTTGSPANIYWNGSRFGADPADVYSLTNVLDAAGAITSGITAVTGAPVYEDSGQTRITGNYIFAAVAPQAGVFGAVNSGVAIIGQTTGQLAQGVAVAGSTTVRAFPFDGTQSFVKIVNNATVSVTPVDMYYDTVLQRLYMVYEATSAGAVGDGVRGIVVGYINQVATPGPGVGSTTLSNYMALTDFAPAAAFAGSGVTAVGGAVSVGAPVVVTISKIRTMQSSMGYTYGILVGSSNNGVFPAARSVFAVPLVNKSVDPTNKTWPLDPTQGTLASKVSAPGTNAKTFFDNTNTCLPYSGRGFQVPATTLADLTLQTDAAARVGGGATSGTINDICVIKDAVFVACDASATEAAGLFTSQALFDGNGVIKGWTPWQRVTAPINAGSRIYGIGYQPSVGKFFTMEGSSASTVDIVATTTWSDHEKDGFLGGTTTDATVGFMELISAQFSVDKGGIQGAFDFPANTDGFVAAGGNTRLSAMVFTGYKRVVFAQTGANSAGGVFTPARGDFSTNMEIKTDGTVVTPGAGALIISVTGGALDDLGGITSAIIVNDGVASAYLVVAGVGGVAVLRPGWPTAGLQKNFANLPASAFVKIGSYKNVRKLLSDGTNLYVLTNTTLDRIPATQLSGTMTPTVLATAQSMGLATFAQFSDVVISSKVALLATSQGLYRNGNGTSIATGAAGGFNWQALTFGETPGAITRLEPLSTTGLPQDFSGSAAGAGATAGGTVYVLGAAVSLGLASVYRVAVKDTRAANVIDDTTVQVLQEYFVSRNTSAFVALGTYRNFFRTDGALLTDSRSLYDGVEPALNESLSPLIRTGVIFYPKRMVAPILDNIPHVVSIGNLIKNSGLGSLILPTNDGMRVLG